MLLNDRKIKILEAIVNDYIQTAEPIGSRTIAKKYDLGISSATIRNEMSDLEEMGLIIQPHASAGRVPSDKGYRLYVDKLMHHRELAENEIEFLKQLVATNVSHIDYLMQETAKAISVLTKYTTVVTSPKASKTKIKHIQLVPIDRSELLIVLVVDGNIVKHHQMNMEDVPGYEELNNLSVYLNEALKGTTIDTINRTTLLELKEKFTQSSHLLMPVLEAVIGMLETQDNVQVFTSGVKNILAFPEFSDLEKAKAIFQALEERDILITLLERESMDNIQVVIGSENTLSQMKDCSIIKANYFLENSSFGSIGIIGPTRMDYGQVISVLKGIVKNINSALRLLSGG